MAAAESVPERFLSNLQDAARNRRKGPPFPGLRFSARDVSVVRLCRAARRIKPPNF